MIPDEAAEAAAEWLPHSGDCEARPERDCTCWKARVDLMRAALEAAAPHVLRDAWRDGADAYFDQLSEVASDWVVVPNPYDEPTPYRTTK